MLIQSDKIENSFLNDWNLKIMKENEIKKKEKLTEWETNRKKSYKKNNALKDAQWQQQWIRINRETMQQ